MNRRKVIMPVFLSILLLIVSVSITMNKDKKCSSAVQALPVSTKPVGFREQDVDEMRAVWVPFMALDMKNEDDYENRFKEKFDLIVKKSKEHNLNTLIVHVRSHGDAMYNSKYYPWSHLITGKQGRTPSFDPLKYMVEETHKNGMYFHAWINPLRVQVNDTPEELSENNPYVKWRNDGNESTNRFVLDCGQDKYYNPAYPEVRKLIINGVKEIVANYDVDGIHFDDYFYPTESLDYDKECYEEYLKSAGNGETALSQSQWRMANIDALISGVYSGIKSVKENVVFGISPQGNMDNNQKISANPKSWGSMPGYVDYLCPQIYFNFENEVLPFDKTVDQWRKMVTCKGVKLYIGIGAYKAGSDVDDGSWLQSNDILKREIEYTRKAKSDGFALYSWDYLDNPQTEQEVANVMKILD